MNAEERGESARGANRTRIFVLGDDPESSDLPAVVMLEMPPKCVLFRHAHICHRFEAVVKGSLEAAGRILQPGDVMTARLGEMYGPHTAGPEGCTTVEVFGSLEGVFRVISETQGRRPGVRLSHGGATRGLPAARMSPSTAE